MQEVFPREKIDRLADIIMNLQRCFMVQLSEELARGRVSFPQFFLLGHINSAGTLTMTEIAEAMNHSTAAASGLVDRLENLGYVNRCHSPLDRRKVLVEITANGRALVGRIKEDIVKNLSCLMESLTFQEREMWLQIYEKIFELCLSRKQDI